MKVYLLWENSDCECGCDILQNIYEVRKDAEVFIKKNSRYRSFWIEDWVVKLTKNDRKNT